MASLIDNLEIVSRLGRTEIQMLNARSTCRNINFL